ncbi:MAG TPA: cupin domain-containing protein [Acidimicrobiales bacterium]|nr:cupin domain-containing protein [Acidimicrobiales bacterium]
MATAPERVRAAASRSGTDLEGIELLGERLRAERAERGIGVRELARMVDCSASLISQIERGRANPSVSTLYALSSALGLSLDSLFAKPGAPPPRATARRKAASPPERTKRQRPSVVIGPSERRVINLERGVQWQLLMPVPEHNAEFMEVHYAPGGGSTADDRAIRHNGREYCLVLEGTLSVEIGFERYDLEPGDSMAFDSTIPHRIWNAGPSPVRAVWFVIDRWATSAAPEEHPPGDLANRAPH